MPHLSPMGWTLFLMLIWCMTISWSSINYHHNYPFFPKSMSSKPLLTTSSWKWL